MYLDVLVGIEKIFFVMLCILEFWFIEVCYDIFFCKEENVIVIKYGGNVYFWCLDGKVVMLGRSM